MTLKRVLKFETGKEWQIGLVGNNVWSGGMGAAGGVPSKECREGDRWKPCPTANSFSVEGHRKAWNAGIPGRSLPFMDLQLKLHRREEMSLQTQSYFSYFILD